MEERPPDAREAGPIEAPYGTWSSPILVEDLVADVVRLAEPWVDGDDVYWIEGRPAEAGRRALVQRAADGTTTDLTPAPFDVRTRVHEYGGGSYVVSGSTAVFSNLSDGRLYRLDPGSDAPVAITPKGPYRYGDLRPDAIRRRFLAVREEDRPDGEPIAAIVAVALDGDQEPQVLVDGPDFLASPRISPDTTTLARLEWDHPDMPWDATRLRVAPFAADGSLEPSDLAAGGPEEAIVQPEWSPDGVLHLVSDRSGWWNLYRLLDGPRLESLAAMEAEFADPPWILDRASYGFVADGSIVAVARSDGQDRLLHVQPELLAGEVDTTYTEFDGLRVGPSTVVALAGAPDEATVVASFDPSSLATSGVLRRSAPSTPDPAFIARPESIAFPSTDDRMAHALYYPPTNPEHVAPAGTLPPLVVCSHGGPTSNVSSALDLEIQLLTSRGLAVVDVDYAGSTGYGRRYRDALRGAWGVADVDDCCAAARFLVDRGEVDPARMAIVGSSAGGYTTLAALAFRDVFAAGISEYGIGDLESMVGDAHKFEARYLDGLVGPYPDEADLYRRRSPVHHLDAISCPVLVLQGLDDRVVPPAQAEAIVAALTANGIPHAYVAFEGEGHGFRGADAIRRSMAAKIGFLGAVFGFTPAGDIEPLALPGLDEWRARRSVPAT